MGGDDRAVGRRSLKSAAVIDRGGNKAKMWLNCGDVGSAWRMPGTTLTCCTEDLSLRRTFPFADWLGWPIYRYLKFIFCLRKAVAGPFSFSSSSTHPRSEKQLQAQTTLIQNLGHSATLQTPPRIPKAAFRYLSPLSQQVHTLLVLSHNVFCRRQSRRQPRKREHPRPIQHCQRHCPG